MTSILSGASRRCGHMHSTNVGHPNQNRSVRRPHQLKVGDARDGGIILGLNTYYTHASVARQATCITLFVSFGLLDLFPQVSVETPKKGRSTEGCADVRVYYLCVGRCSAIQIYVDATAHNTEGQILRIRYIDK